MSDRKRKNVLYALLTGIAVGFGAWTYEVAIGFPRYVDGEWVRRRTSWYGWHYGNPIPRAKAEVYYYYRNEQGEEVRHGAIRQYHGNEALHTVGRYWHGKSDGTWTRWDDTGRKTGQAIWRKGERIGWSVYVNGELQYHNEELYDENGTPIATKRFEGGLWFLRFYSGQKPTLQIDPETGEVSPLKEQ